MPLRDDVHNHRFPIDHFKESLVWNIRIIAVQNIKSGHVVFILHFKLGLFQNATLDCLEMGSVI